MTHAHDDEPEWYRTLLLLARLGQWEAFLFLYLTLFYGAHPDWLFGEPHQRWRRLINEKYGTWYNEHKEVWERINLEVRHEQGK